MGVRYITMKVLVGIIRHILEQIIIFCLILMDGCPVPIGKIRLPVCKKEAMHMGGDCTVFLKAVRI